MFAPPPGARSAAPTGTVTFFFTDIEGSTKLAQSHPAAWPALQARHHAILKSAIESHSGSVFQIIGDAFCAAFHTAPEALAAAIDAQRALQAEAWGETPIRARIGLHTGAATLRPGGDYEGYLALATVQRVMSTAHGGQTLVSSSTAALLAGQLPDGVTLRDMGEHRLKSLLNPERLWQVVAPNLPAAFPPLQSLNTIPNNLPLQVTSLVGREKEVAEVKRLLGTTRLLTLTGSGGTGKTRLSLQVAAEVLDLFPDGAWFVELAPLADPVFVAQTVATALGVREQPGRPMLTTLCEYLRDKQVLLILDNCEHLIETCARLADTLQHAAPKLALLASSREALGIAGETAYRVPSLETPNPKDQISTAELSHYASVQLFSERAKQALTTFSVTNANAPAVAQICYRLDGIPLAIELAASRVKALSAEQIAARLDDRFRLLTGGSRTALPRQQTLRGAIDWSYSLLSEPERVLLRRLSVFAGGWTLEAAESVCSSAGIDTFEVLDLVTHLVEKSLVVVEEIDGEARYRMLETIRQYARDKLLESGESGRVRARHFAYFYRQATVFAENWDGPEQVTWFERIASDLDNLRTALEWSIESNETVPGMQMAGELHPLWFQRFPAEGMDHVSRFLSREETQGISLARAVALRCIGSLPSFIGDYAAARGCLEEALAIGKALGAEPLTAAALHTLGDAAIGLGEYDVAMAYLAEGLEISRRLGDVFRIGDILFVIGDVAMRQGQLEQAQIAYDEALTVYRPRHDNLHLPMPLRRLGQIARRRAEYERAVQFIRESLTLNNEGKDTRAVAACLSALAAVHAAQGKTLVAIKVCGTVDALLEALHTGMLTVDQDEYEETLFTLRNQVAPAAFAAAFAAGRALTLEQAIALALSDASQKNNGD